MVVLISLSVLMGVYEAFLYYKDIELTKSLYTVWALIFIILLALWVSEDSKKHKDIYKPYEFGFLVFIFYIPYMPYYLIKTRGWLLGIGYLVGFLLLFNIGLILQFLIYLSL